ncbi:hypothetical protein MRB53_013063 [Persea americana]|uniref:Uncharacterized protein n=1 Tax=Persea americana TaxID=3435 RepID=A0ACC2K7A8_PERAE|nr:hypothetical protein MRB53_013063 [Persea americana]
MKTNLCHWLAWPSDGGDVGSDAVSSRHWVGKVSVLHNQGGDPLKGSPGVIVGGGEGVLWGTTVVDGDDEDIGFCGKGVEVRVVGGGGRRSKCRSSRVEVDKDGEFLGLGRWFGEVYNEQVYDAMLIPIMGRE